MLGVVDGINCLSMMVEEIEFLVYGDSLQKEKFTGDIIQVTLVLILEITLLLLLTLGILLELLKMVVQQETTLMAN